MKSPTRPSPARENLQFQLDLKTQEVLMELNALLRISVNVTERFANT